MELISHAICILERNLFLRLMLGLPCRQWGFAGAHMPNASSPPGHTTIPESRAAQQGVGNKQQPLQACSEGKKSTEQGRPPALSWEPEMPSSAPDDTGEVGVVPAACTRPRSRPGKLPASGGALSADAVGPSKGGPSSATKVSSCSCLLYLFVLPTGALTNMVDCAHALTTCLGKELKSWAMLICVCLHLSEKLTDA